MKAYYNPEQEERIEEASNPSVERMYAASNKGMGFIRIRCADCMYYNQVSCPRRIVYIPHDDWFCGNFKPGDGGEDENIG